VFLYAFHAVDEMYAQQPVWYRDLGSEVTSDGVVDALSAVESDRYRGNVPDTSPEHMLATFRAGADAAVAHWQAGSTAETSVFRGRSQVFIKIANEAPKTGEAR
jgi:hypothetical protein